MTVMIPNPADGSFAERVSTGSARRRRERRLRSMLRHERMSVAMALAEKLHHSACRSVPLKEELVEHEMYNAPRGQKTASGRGTEFFDVFDEELGGGRPPPLPEVAGPQARVLRRTVEPIIESFVPVQMIDVPVPQSSMGGVLDHILQRTAEMVPEEVILVIEVPKISSLLCPPPRRDIPVPQMAMRGMWGGEYSRCLRVLWTGSGRGLTALRGRFLVVPRAPYGRGTAIGSRCWPLLASVWRAIAPLMQPWCAEEEVPTAANVNLYRGWKSCVGWHCDDEPLFGVCGEAKLIVLVSLDSSAVFRWRRQSCPDDEGHLCCLGHGDVLVMDGQCQDEFLHRTDPGLEQEPINVAFRWIRQHTASCPLRTGVVRCLPTCAQGSSAAVTEGVEEGRGEGGGWYFFGTLGAPWSLVHVGGAGFAGISPHVYTTRVTEVCLSLDTPFGRRLAGAFSA